MSLSFTITIMDEKPQTVNITHFGMLVTVSIRVDRYMHGGGLAVELVTDPDGEWYATVSMNLGLPDLADDEFVFKTYSENERLLEELLGEGAIEKTGKEVEVGMAGPQPICRLLKSKR